MSFLTRPALLVLIAGITACERPPVHKTFDAGLEPPPPGTIEPDLEGFYNDRYAVGHKWYLHDSGVLTPKDEVFLVVDRGAAPPTTFKFEVTSYYDNISGESGFFTIRHAAWEGAAWGEPAELVLSGTVKNVPPICVDLTAGGEVACTGNGWQVQFQANRYLSPAILFPLAHNPNIVVRSTSGAPERGDVRIAVVEAIGLEAVTVDPATVADLTEAPANTFGSTEFPHDVWAKNLPQNGMAIGRAWYAPGGASTEHVYFVRTLDLHFVKFAFLTDPPSVPEPITDPPTAVTIRAQVADDEEGVVALEGAEVIDHTIELPSPYGVAYVDFSSDPIAVDLGGDLLHDLPVTTEWDLALEVTSEGVQILLSPAALIYDWTASELGAGSTDFEGALPPLY